MSGHEPGQVGVVLDDEDARIALPPPGPPHAAPSQSSAGTIADRRRRSSGCGARRMGHGPSAPDGRGHPMTSSPSGIPLRRRSPARPVPEVISAPPRSTSRSDEPALLTATARNDPAPSIMPVRRPGCAAFGRVPGGPAHRHSTSVVPRLARHARRTTCVVVRCYHDTRPTTDWKKLRVISADAIRGYIDLIVLTLLRDRPSYAYEIAKTITEVTAGEYAIKQTTLYSALKRLEAAGLTSSYADTSASGKPRTYYRLTNDGAAYLAAKLAEWESTKTLIDRFTQGRH